MERKTRNVTNVIFHLYTRIHLKTTPTRHIHKKNSTCVPPVIIQANMQVVCGFIKELILGKSSTNVYTVIIHVSQNRPLGTTPVHILAKKHTTVHFVNALSVKKVA